MLRPTTGRQFNKIIETQTNCDCELKCPNDAIEPFIHTKDLEEEFTIVIELSDRIIDYLSMLKFKAHLGNRRMAQPGNADEEKQYSEHPNTSNTCAVKTPRETK